MVVPVFVGEGESFGSGSLRVVCIFYCIARRGFTDRGHKVPGLQ